MKEQNIDWKKFEELTGYNIVFAALGGSRLYSLQGKSSDYDYIVFVAPKEGQEIPSPNPLHLPEFEKIDFFIREADCKITRWANIWTVPLYGSIVYAHELIADFLETNKKDLANMNPFVTFRTCQEAVERYFKENTSSKISLVLREASAIYKFIQEEDFSNCADMDEEFFFLSRSIKRKMRNYTVDEIKEKIWWLYDPRLFKLFQYYPFNEKLFNEFCSKLKEIEQTVK